jgi:hypothetical protein
MVRSILFICVFPFFLAAFPMIYITAFPMISLHFQLFIALLSINFSCAPYYFILHCLWFIAVFPMIYSPNYLMIRVMLLLVYFHFFFLYSPWFITAFPIIYSSIPFYLFLYSPISIALLLHTSVIFATYPNICCCIPKY